MLVIAVISCSARKRGRAGDAVARHGDLQASPGRQRAEDLPQHRVEGQSGQLGDAVGVRESGPGRQDRRAGGYGAVGNQDGLGGSGASAGVPDAGGHPACDAVRMTEMYVMSPGAALIHRL
ncbi:hypothetical protein GZL_00972 [Streptomyces sp. 769]|nr:hypothetical protein GZL_00972 [Streptomyces sp. 769]